MRPDVSDQPGPFTFFSDGVGVDDLRKEIFFLAYHLHWSHESLMEMDVEERRAYCRMLVEQIERENSQMQAARRA